ncbi:MAG TPA: hypothetical protein PLB10_13425 [Thiolinea sp.]|nr:hypothetical protein [Thiolinea sp.]
MVSTASQAAQRVTVSAGVREAPPYEGFFIDPDTGLRVWRLGGSQQEMGSRLAYPDGNEALGILHGQHFYSKTSPVNQDETLVLGSGGQNQPHAALWSLKQHRLIAWVPGPRQEANIQQRQLLWDRHDPLVYWFAEGNRLMRARIEPQTFIVTAEVWDRFPEYRYVTFGYGEGNFSDDGRRIVLMGPAQESGFIFMLPYEVEQKKVLPRRQLTSATQPEVDWAGVDPTGQYILFDQSVPDRRTVVVRFDQAAVDSPRLIYEHAKHSDFVIDHQGDVWIVYGNWLGLFASRLSDGTDRKVWPADNGDDNPFSVSGHVARVAGQPGMVLVSRNVDGGLYLVDIDQPEKVRYVGNSRQGRKPEQAKETDADWGVDSEGEVTFYKREPRGAISRSGKYVFFTGDYQFYLRSGYDSEPEPCRAYLNMIEVE